MSRLAVVLVALTTPLPLVAQTAGGLARLEVLRAGDGAAGGTAAGLRGLAALTSLAEFAQDPADGLNRQAREALNRGDYARAIDLFTEIRSRHPRSAHTPDAFYWEAFAHQRRGQTEGLHTALELLALQGERHPNAGTRTDARSLAIRIESELARRGDAASAAALAERGSRIAPPVPAVPPTPPAAPGAPIPPVAPVPPVPPAVGRQGVSRCAGEDEEQVMVLNGLLNMDADRAVPLLERVMARRDAGSVCLRRRAVFLLAQKRTARTEAILLGVIRTDPDAEVREQGIFWLGQSGGPRAAAALDSILRGSTDEKVQVRAIFALAQMNQPSAGAVLREFAGRAGASREVRDQAVFWLGQSGTPENAQFLQDLYRRESDVRMKERIIFSVSQMARRDQASYGQWLAGIAADAREPMALRKNAIFWAGQSGAPLAQLVQAYDRMPEQEMKEQVIFTLSQRSEREATDKLIAIARGDQNPKLRERAIFWLTQRNDPRVEAILLEILERRPGGAA